MGKNDYKTDPEFFKRALVDAGLSQRGLARLMKIDVASLNRMFSGERMVRADEAVEIARFLHLDLIKVLQKFGIETHNVRAGNGTHK